MDTQQYALRALNGGEDIYEITDMLGSLVTVIPCLTSFRANLYYTGQESNAAQPKTVISLLILFYFVFHCLTLV